MQVFAWQMSGWLLIASALCMLAGMLVLIWSSTLLNTRTLFVDWWNDDAKLAVTFTTVTAVLFALAGIQQWTLYSWNGSDDSDQTDSQKLETGAQNSSPMTFTG